MSKSELKVLRFLVEYKNPETGKCTPLVSEIAAAVGLSRGYVRDITTKLHREGIIEKVERWAISSDEDPRIEIEVSPEEVPYTSNYVCAAPFKVANLYRIIKRDVLEGPTRAIMSTWGNAAARPHLSNASNNMLNAHES